MYLCHIYSLWVCALFLKKAMCQMLTTTIFFLKINVKQKIGRSNNHVFKNFKFDFFLTRKMYFLFRGIYVCTTFFTFIILFYYIVFKFRCGIFTLTKCLEMFNKYNAIFNYITLLLLIKIYNNYIILIRVDTKLEI